MVCLNGQATFQLSGLRCLLAECFTGHSAVYRHSSCTQLCLIQQSASAPPVFEYFGSSSTAGVHSTLYKTAENRHPLVQQYSTSAYKSAALHQSALPDGDLQPAAICADIIIIINAQFCRIGRLHFTRTSSSSRYGIIAAPSSLADSIISCSSSSIQNGTTAVRSRAQQTSHHSATTIYRWRSSTRSIQLFSWTLAEHRSTTLSIAIAFLPTAKRNISKQHRRQEA